MFYINNGNKQDSINYKSVSEAIRDIVQTLMDNVIHYKERIYREFLGIEPPVGYDKEALK